VESYWSEGKVERFEFLRAVQSQLERAGWAFKADTGWTSSDLEILTDNWSRLKLITVSEDLHQGKKNFRCRIKGGWSMPARTILLLGVAVVGLVIASFAETVPWVWLALIVLPLIGWFFEENCREYELALRGLLDAAATEKKLIKLDTALIKAS
jgi:hypothetical protein